MISDPTERAFFPFVRLVFPICGPQDGHHALDCLEFSRGQIVLPAFWIHGEQEQRFRFIMEVINHSNSTTLARSRAAPAHLSNASASGYKIASVRVIRDEADERQTLLVIPYARGFRGERLHLDHCDGGAFHFFKYTPMAHRPQISS